VGGDFFNERFLMYRLILALLLLVGFASISEAQYRSYGHNRSYGHSYGHSYNHGYSYYKPYYAPYHAPVYSYTYYPASWWKGRWYPAGSYYYDGYSYHLKGYGKFDGYDKAPGDTPGPAPEQPKSGLTAEETAKLKELLKKLNDK
jgi:hypothetical protein